MRYFIWKLNLVSNILLMIVDYIDTDEIGNLEDSVTTWNILNQLGKHDFSYGAAVNNFK